jgi:hypothetical protein
MMKSGKSRTGHRAVCEHVTIDQQAFDFLFVPAAPERNGMQRGDRGRIARAGFRQRRLTARKKVAKKTDHRRASCTASCGCASAARRYSGFGGVSVSVAAAPSRATQSMRGAARCSTALGARSLAGHAAASLPAAVPTMRGAPDVETRSASRNGVTRGETTVRPPGPKTLQIDVVVACIDRRDHRKRIVGRDERRGKGSERRQTDGRLASRESNSTRRGDSDAQARESCRARWSPRYDQDRRSRVARFAGFAR